MAAPSSTFHSHSAIKSSISSSSSAFSSFNLYYYSVRRRSISCCPSFLTSLTCCCSSSSGDPQEGKIIPKRSPERNAIAPIEKILKSEKTLTVNNVASKNRSISFKDIFERRSLWRRIFFASKKVRSIILLNVITVIYGNYAFISLGFVFCVSVGKFWIWKKVLIIIVIIIIFNDNQTM